MRIDTVATVKAAKEKLIERLHGLPEKHAFVNAVVHLSYEFVWAPPLSLDMRNARALIEKNFGSWLLKSVDADLRGLLDEIQQKTPKSNSEISPFLKDPVDWPIFSKYYEHAHSLLGA